MLGNIGRSYAGNRTLAFNGIQQGCFFATLVTAATDDQIDVERE